MNEGVKLTFEKSGEGDKITITKDGGFTVEDLGRITEVVEELFESGEDDDDEVEEEDNAEGDQDTKQRRNQAQAQPRREDGSFASKQSGNGGGSGDGRGQPSGETEEGLKVRKDGELDGRSLRAQRTPEQLKDEPFMKRLTKEAGEKSAKQATPARSTAKERGHNGGGKSQGKGDDART